VNKEIIAPASDNEYRYLSLYEESININSRLESKDQLRSIDSWSKIFITTSLKTKNNMGNCAEVIPSIFHNENEIFEC